MKKFCIGLDIGTTSTKAILFNRRGDVISESEIEYSLLKPHSSWAEQNPAEIEHAAKKALYRTIYQKNINPKELIAVGISAAMHSIICIDEHNEAISPAIVWADGRSVSQAEKLRNAEGTNIYLKTGTPIHPMSPLAKLMWMKETGYEPYRKANKFVSIKEYLLFKWFGTYVVDYSIAAATGFLNIHTLLWEQDALQLAGISEDHLSKLVPPTYQLHGLDSRVAEGMGVPQDLPFIIGASDGPLANLGIGAINKGEVAITIGTSGAIRQMTSFPKTDTKQEIFCYSFTDNLWVMGGPTNNGGIVLQWLKELLVYNDEGPATNVSYESFIRMAETIKPGAENLLFLPYLNGERSPFWDANAKGSFIGLTLSHKKEHLIRAGLEGVIYSIYHVGEALERLGDEPTRLLASGGFARSPLWVQMLADIFGKEVYIPESHQSSAWGAAWIALYSLGEVKSLESIKESIPMKSKVLPNEGNHLLYQKYYQIYRSLYLALKDQFGQLSRL